MGTSLQVTWLPAYKTPFEVQDQRKTSAKLGHEQYRFVLLTLELVVAHVLFPFVCNS